MFKILDSRKKKTRELEIEMKSVSLVNVTLEYHMYSLYFYNNWQLYENKILNKMRQFDTITS